MKPLCPFPFTHLATQSTGAIRACCISRDSLSPHYNNEGGFHIGRHSIQEFWESEHMNTLRKQMLSDELPLVCGACIESEKLGKGNTRDSWMDEDDFDYLNKQIEQFVTSGTVGPPISLDISYGSLCNLSCRMCHLPLSSQLTKEFERNLDEDWTDYHRAQAPAAKTLQAWHEKPEFQEELNRLIPEVTRMRIRGGEPLIIPEVLSWIDRCIETGEAAHIRVRFMTNGVKVTPEILKKLSYFRSATLNFSIDGVEEIFEYIRHPARWSVVSNNALAARDSGMRVSISYTSQIYNIFSVDRLYAWAANERIPVMLDHLTTPPYFSTAILPAPLKHKALEAIAGVPNKADRHSLETFLAIEKTDASTAWKDFWRISRTMDRVRKESIFDIYSFLRDFQV